MKTKFLIIISIILSLAIPVSTLITNRYYANIFICLLSTVLFLVLIKICFILSKSEKTNVSTALVSVGESIPNTLSVLTLFRTELSKMAGNILNSVFTIEKHESYINTIITDKKVGVFLGKKFTGFKSENSDEKNNLTEIMKINGFLCSEDMAAIKNHLNNINAENQILASRLQLHDIIEQQLSALSINLKQLMNQIENNKNLKIDLTEYKQRQLKSKIQKEFEKIKSLNGLNDTTC